MSPVTHPIVVARLYFLIQTSKHRNAVFKTNDENEFKFIVKVGIFVYGLKHMTTKLFIFYNLLFFGI